MPVPAPSLPIPIRGSARSRAAAAVSFLTLRQLSSVLPPEQFWGLWTSRQLVAAIMATFGPPLPATPVQRVDERMPDGRRVVGEWVYPPIAAPAGATKAAIYFLHGSGYAMCSPRTHRRLTGRLAALTGLPVFCVDYRLAPRHRFPAAADDVHAGWDWLQLNGFEPANVAIAGDSAGGHLAVSLLGHEQTSHPAALCLFSPLIDLTFSTARSRERHRRDPAIRVDDAVRLVQLYCGETDLSHPRLTIDIAGGRTFPPTLVQAGGAEMLAGDAQQLAIDIRAAGGDCELQIWPDQVHVFQALPRLSPEAGPALAAAAQFITTALDLAPTATAIA